jgi:hypothetical protein
LHYKTGWSYASWFDQMRVLVLERDKACVVCSTTKQLHCHHVDQDVRDNRPEKLIMLCSTHHMEHHKSSTPRQRETSLHQWIAALADYLHVHAVRAA